MDLVEWITFRTSTYTSPVLITTAIRSKRWWEKYFCFSYTSKQTGKSDTDTACQANDMRMDIQVDDIPFLQEKPIAKYDLMSWRHGSVLSRSGLGTRISHRLWPEHIESARSRTSLKQPTKPRSCRTHLLCCMRPYRAPSMTITSSAEHDPLNVSHAQKSCISTP